MNTPTANETPHTCPFCNLKEPEERLLTIGNAYACINDLVCTSSTRHITLNAEHLSALLWILNDANKLAIEANFKAMEEKEKRHE